MLPWQEVYQPIMDYAMLFTNLQKNMDGQFTFLSLAIRQIMQL